MLGKKLSARILIIITIFAMAGDIVAKESTNKKIVLPFCEETISTSSLIRSIELSDTATIINYSFVYRPKYWCRINQMELVGNNTGKVYISKAQTDTSLAKSNICLNREDLTFPLHFRPSTVQIPL